MISKFNFRAFAESMTEQAEEMVPQDLSKEAENYLVETLNNYALLAGESLENDTELNLAVNQKNLLSRLLQNGHSISA